jgi:hypothetical protein
VGSIDILVDVPTKAHLNRHVPTLRFDLQTRIKEKRNNFCCVHLIKLFCILVVGYTGCMHPYHTQTPSSNILQLNMQDNSTNKQHFIEVTTFCELLSRSVDNFKGISEEVTNKADEECSGFKQHGSQTRRYTLIVTHSIHIILKISKLEDRPNETSR